MRKLPAATKVRLRAELRHSFATSQSIRPDEDAAIVAALDAGEPVVVPAHNLASALFAVPGYADVSHLVRNISGIYQDGLRYAGDVYPATWTVDGDGNITPNEKRA